ncbi:MAG: hypothetical protein A3J10_00135 [Candidatus Sungbacteria bacterium RIFCSPLOWO2_02_FULL_54_10]|uniref:Uncharacterized protein n=2 Tax=Candidatus Sungiibacteriota TaxID=1817917 RepID=A0A1G2L992_9BACT|nr:MAG: hypothetical protein A2679_01035 [Candidatus Sungbacteria bacterium RIFCSPHIGHO2_01_FULL_54_26]OHA03979.1 MAG: hypothetical protein A3C92_02225 [Candidatus Sungbacteria bacterium RIFCSPHIGHO2_02_FULL_53_17]OHA08100.1 MAG: hypothetical protein A3B34_02275 [Candidatus Sungbacteria bacterium RIFCSPLOWO2_01_FULL_54_21]OHA12848.1 MAG: hypothetical protein A3J10_00135 [Candidatus Sungbacteria bacterium RIFCSPLOWO2_02_FULL_54_10]
MVKVSHDWIRLQLQKGFEELLSMLPKGDEEVLDAEYEFRGKTHSLIEEHSALCMLKDFAKNVRMLSKCYPPEKVTEILQQHGGSQMIFKEDEGPLVQRWID